MLQGPPPTQHEAPRGLMPDLQDDPLTIDDAVEEEDPDLRSAQELLHMAPFARTASPAAFWPCPVYRVKL